MTAIKMKDEMYRQMGLIIDKIGEEQLNEFIDISIKIKDTLSQIKLSF